MKKLPLILFAFLLLVISAFAQTDVKPIVDEANRLYKKGKYAEAAAQISNAIAVQPNDASLYIQRANFYYEIPDNPSGVKDLLTAASLSPKDEKILFTAARELRRTGRIQEALNIIESLLALKLSATYLVRTYNLSSECKRLLKDYRGAFDDKIREIELAPTAKKDRTDEEMKLVYEMLGTMRTLLESSSSSLVYDLENDENVLIYHERLFDVIERKNREWGENQLPLPWDKVTILGRKPDFVEDIQRNLRRFQIKCAGLYWDKGQTGKAEEMLQRVVQNGQNWESYQDRAQFYLKKGLDKEAAADWNTIIIELTKEIDKTDIPYYKSSFYDTRGDYHIYLKQYEKAIEDFETAITLDSRYAPRIEKKIASLQLKIKEDANRQK